MKVKHKINKKLRFAFQWNGEDWHEFIKPIYKCFERETPKRDECRLLQNYIVDNMQPGTWMILNKRGNFIFLSNEKFIKTYEEVEE